MSNAILSELTDVELVQLCQAHGMKDERPFRELFRRHQKLVWRACYSFFRNAQDAEDITQEVFFKVYRSLPKFEGRSAFKTWIYRIAINTSQNELRRRSRRPQLAGVDTDTLAEILPDNHSPEREWQEKEQRRLLSRALTELRPDEMEVLLLKDFEERPYAEIANKLGIGLSATKMRVVRARVALQMKYREIDQGAGSNENERDRYRTT